jgi:hypothetical protein
MEIPFPVREGISIDRNADRDDLEKWKRVGGAIKTYTVTLGVLLRSFGATAGQVAQGPGLPGITDAASTGM